MGYSPYLGSVDQDITMSKPRNFSQAENITHYKYITRNHSSGSKSEVINSNNKFHFFKSIQFQIFAAFANLLTLFVSERSWKNNESVLSISLTKSVLWIVSLTLLILMTTGISLLWCLVCPIIYSIYIWRDISKFNSSLIHEI